VDWKSSPAVLLRVKRRKKEKEEEKTKKKEIKNNDYKHNPEFCGSYQATYICPDWDLAIRQRRAEFCGPQESPALARHATFALRSLSEDESLANISPGSAGECS
jgi:hypothetical protein